MTENQKLRTLLAEARAITQDSLESNTTGFDEEFKVCRCDSCERYRSIIRRIDAALAEPVRGCESCGDKTYLELLDDNVRVRAERDEARAEVERLGKALTQETQLSLSTQRQLDEARAEVERLQKRLGDKAELSSKKLADAFTTGTLAAGDAMRGHIAAAYQRGAEAMREAAARELDRLLTQKKATAIWVAPDEIRAMPVPEDK